VSGSPNLEWAELIPLVRKDIWVQNQTECFCSLGENPCPGVTIKYFDLLIIKMREFILLALKAKTTPDFVLEQLPEAGRMDLVCRTIANTLYVSNEMRRDTVIHVSMNGPRDPPKLMSFYGETMKGLGMDERAIGEMIRNTLKKGTRLALGEEIEASPGIKISKKAFETLLKEKSQTSQLIYLHKKGEDIRTFQFKENNTFVLGDYIGLPGKTEKLLDRLGAQKIKLGPTMLFASHCPIIVHNELDRRIKEQFEDKSAQ